MKITKIIFCCFLLVLPSALRAQAKSDHEALTSVRHFVQEFYDWYAPNALIDSSDPAWNRVLKVKGSCLSPELAQALREDSAAQAKAEGDLVGLDFDPFLDSQDPAKRYEAGKIAQKGQTYWLDIHNESSGKRSEKPDLVAEVGRHNGQWVFVNFHYPEGGDLLSILRELRQNRRVAHP